MAESGGTETREVVVIGGGPAGLAAALVLGRARRSVTVVDAGNPRNACSPSLHGFLTRDGTTPEAFLAAARREVGGYGVELVRDEVVAVVGHDDDGEPSFRVTLAGGRVLRARRLVAATGLTDELPDVAGVAERWGRDVLHCPYCHGWEVRDEPIAILATGPMAVHQALLWRQWSDRVTVLRHTAPPFGEDDAERLAARGIAVIDGEAAALEVEDDRLVGLALADGSTVACRALAVAPRFTASASLLTGLGLEASEMVHQGHVLGSYIEADATGATSVPGVWVAGNVASPMAQVVASAEAGVRAAGAINADLIEAETARAVAARRKALAA